MSGSFSTVSADWAEANSLSRQPEIAGGATESPAGGGNEPVSRWDQALQDMRFHAWGSPACGVARGNQPEEDRLWADLARRARETWANENPY